MIVYYKIFGREELTVMPVSEIEELTNHFIEQLLPIQIYLFGSYASRTNTNVSDFDFYIVVLDTVTDVLEETTKAYRSIRSVKRRPVDIIVGTKSRFEARKQIPSIENEVFRKGVLLYDAGKGIVEGNNGNFTK